VKTQIEPKRLTLERWSHRRVVKVHPGAMEAQHVGAEAYLEATELTLEP
jgi:hypothetical protein